MNQQPMTLRRFARSALRYKRLVIAAGVIGLVGGVGYAALTPPELTSQALVVLPQPKPNISTQTLIAGSVPVLQDAVSVLGGGESITSLQQKINVVNVTPNVIQITAKDKTAAAAEKDANTVASSYIQYVGSTNSPVGRIAAHILVSADSATGTSLVAQEVDYGVIGLAAGIAIGMIVAAQRNRNDPRLRRRAQLTQAVGAPVLGSVVIEPPAGAAGWQRLFGDYQPATALSWQLRRVLDQAGVAAASSGKRQSYLTVVTLDGDEAAFAVGPQLAAFAASMGIATLLVLGPRPGLAARNGLYEAYSGTSMTSPGQRLTNLRITTPDAADTDWKHPNAVLTLAVATVDGNAPALPDPVRGSKAILAVSAGASTVQQLNRIVAAVDDVGSRVAGIIVANPEPDDETAGVVRSNAAHVSSRFSGIANGEVREVRR